MKYLFIIVLLALPPKAALAETLTDSDGLEVMKNLNTLKYWSKGPFSLLLYCNNKYPGKGNVANDLYTNWNKKNLDYNIRIDTLNNHFSSLMAAKLNKSEDEWEAHMTKMLNRIIKEKMDNEFKGIDDETGEYYCSEGFTEILDAMFSKDLIKPQVTISSDNLEKFKRTQQW